MWHLPSWISRYLVLHQTLVASVRNMIALFSQPSSEFMLEARKYCSISNKKFSSFSASHSPTYGIEFRIFAFSRRFEAPHSWEILPKDIIITFTMATSSLISNKKVAITSFISMVRSLIVSPNYLSLSLIMASRSSTCGDAPLPKPSTPFIGFKSIDSSI